jgi:hypothetical protein
MRHHAITLHFRLYLAPWVISSPYHCYLSLTWVICFRASRWIRFMLMINTLSGGTGLYLKHRHTSVCLCPQPFSLCTSPLLPQEGRALAQDCL